MAGVSSHDSAGKNFPAVCRGSGLLSPSGLSRPHEANDAPRRDLAGTEACPARARKPQDTDAQTASLSGAPRPASMSLRDRCLIDDLPEPQPRLGWSRRLCLPDRTMPCRRLNQTASATRVGQASLPAKSKPLRIGLPTRCPPECRARVGEFFPTRSQANVPSAAAVVRFWDRGPRNSASSRPMAMGNRSLPR